MQIGEFAKVCETKISVLRKAKKMMLKAEFIINVEFIKNTKGIKAITNKIDGNDANAARKVLSCAIAAKG